MNPSIYLAGLLGPFAIGCTLIVLGRLSQRLGHVAEVRPYYLGLYVAAGLVWAGMLVRLYFITRGLADSQALEQNVLYTLLNDGLPAIGITLGLILTWYYWSWLLAERD